MVEKIPTLIIHIKYKNIFHQMMLLKKEMSVKQEEDVVQPCLLVKEEPHEDALIQAGAQRRLCAKRLTRNAYMKKYRVHQRLLPIRGIDKISVTHQIQYCHT